jgi:hypothetical protein
MALADLTIRFFPSSCSFSKTNILLWAGQLQQRIMRRLDSSIFERTIPSIIGVIMPVSLLT